LEVPYMFGSDKRRPRQIFFREAITEERSMLGLILISDRPRY